MLCKICKQKLKVIYQGFDAFSFLNPIELRYCENNECSEFGNVTVVGIPEDKQKQNE